MTAPTAADHRHHPDQIAILRSASIDALFALEGMVILQGRKELEPTAARLRAALWPNFDDDSSHAPISSEDD